MPEINREALREFGRIYPERLPTSEEDQAEFDRLCVECEAWLNEHEDDASEEVRRQIGALSERIDTLSEGTERWEPEDIALCGAVVGIGHGGRIVVERGLQRPEDLTAHRTAALRAILAVNPDVALAAVVHALALPLFYPHSGESCLELDLHQPVGQPVLTLGLGNRASLRPRWGTFGGRILKNKGLKKSATGFEDSTAARSLAEWQEVWEQKLPGRAEEFWDWLLAQDTATRLDLMAYCAGCSVNAVKKAQERADAERFAHADQLAAALDLDMAQWWQPTGASYLSRVPKAKVLEAVSEGVTKGAAENLAKLKKEALVTLAEERLAGTGWLPAVLRRKLPDADVPEIAAAA